ncbi:MAG: carboxymuconolactone decarboxylase family protein [Planctomycetota bacterium]|nr:carboxymuconolactone decarboxylase family protein [Planctomycetota bacterium]
MPRIPLVPDDAIGDDVAPIFQRVREAYGQVPNLIRTLAHQPAATGPLMDLFATLYEDSPLDKRLIELGIIVVSFRQQSEYCLTLHKAFALDHGATTEEIQRLRDDTGFDAFAPDEQAVLRFAAAFADDPLTIDDALYAGLREHFDDASIVSLSFLLGLGLMFGQIANALRIPPDAVVLPPK